MVLESSEQQKRGFRDLIKSNKKSIISNAEISDLDYFTYNNYFFFTALFTKEIHILII